MQHILVIKIGGNIIDDANALHQFLDAISSIAHPIVLIHGGGKLATQLATTLQVPQQMINGRRVTDEETLKIVTMVYAGYINKNIVAQLQARKRNAIGITGADANMILAHKRIHSSIDYGFVGNIDHVQANVLHNLLAQQYVPVIAPITHDGTGQLLNTNADTIANEIAKALSATNKVTLLYCFDKKGVLKDVDDETSIIPSITQENIEHLKTNNIIHTGMIPKIDNALAAVAAGVHNVVLGHALDVLDIVAGKTGTVIH
jgi:acetylglutamate kinase